MTSFTELDNICCIPFANILTRIFTSEFNNLSWTLLSSDNKSKDNYYLMSLNRSHPTRNLLVLWGCWVLPCYMVIFRQIIFCHRNPIVSNNWRNSRFHLRVFKDFYLRSCEEKVAAQKQMVWRKRLGFQHHIWLAQYSCYHSCRALYVWWLSASHSRRNKVVTLLKCSHLRLKEGILQGLWEGLTKAWVVLVLLGARKGNILQKMKSGRWKKLKLQGSHQDSHRWKIIKVRMCEPAPVLAATLSSNACSSVMISGQRCVLVLVSWRCQKPHWSMWHPWAPPAVTPSKGKIEKCLETPPPMWAP